MKSNSEEMEDLTNKTFPDGIEAELQRREDQQKREDDLRAMKEQFGPYFISSDIEKQYQERIRQQEARKARLASMEQPIDLAKRYTDHPGDRMVVVNEPGGLTAEQVKDLLAYLAFYRGRVRVLSSVDVALSNVETRVR